MKIKIVSLIVTAILGNSSACYAMNTQENSQLLQIPQNVVVRVYSFMSIGDRIVLKMVCKTFLNTLNLTAAIKTKNIPYITELLHLGEKPTSDHLDFAAKCHNILLVELLLAHDAKPHSETVQWAISISENPDLKSLLFRKYTEMLVARANEAQKRDLSYASVYLKVGTY